MFRSRVAQAPGEGHDERKRGASRPLPARSPAATWAPVATTAYPKVSPKMSARPRAPPTTSATTAQIMTLAPSALGLSGRNAQLGKVLLP
jgi:hypothetical protein